MLLEPNSLPLIRCEKQGRLLPSEVSTKTESRAPASFAPVSALSQKQQLSEPEGTTQTRLNLHASDQDQAQKMEMTYQRAHVL